MRIEGGVGVVGGVHPIAHANRSNSVSNSVSPGSAWATSRGRGSCGTGWHGSMHAPVIDAAISSIVLGGHQWPPLLGVLGFKRIDQSTERLAGGLLLGGLLLLTFHSEVPVESNLAHSIAAKSSPSLSAVSALAS